ncbi:uncharacterized protein [Procambarus clarkii]|uniref:uncharacterized protein n=1 Tax=Procambarus clarkii TaxID=6728 RepID=UPI0037435636
MNENGQRLLELCSLHNLCVTITLFGTKPQHRVSRKHPRSMHWHQLDLILTRRISLPSIKITHSCQSAVCDTDHSLICSKVKMLTKMIHLSKKEDRPRIDTSKIPQSGKGGRFSTCARGSSPWPSRGQRLLFKDAVFNAVMSTFGKKTSSLVRGSFGRNDTSHRREEKHLSRPIKPAQISATCRSFRPSALKRWVEHYSELYARENVVTEDPLSAIEHLPVLKKLDREPTHEELSDALDSLASGKALGEDGIPAEALKCCKGNLLMQLHEILCLCWRREVLQDMRNANIVTLYKNKGDRGDCNNYRSISLISIVGKLFA